MSTPATEPGRVPVSDPHDRGMLKADREHLERKAETQRRALDDTLTRLARVRRELFQREVAEAEQAPGCEF